MARGLCILLLVVVSAVALASAGRRRYDVDDYDGGSSVSAYPSGRLSVRRKYHALDRNYLYRKTGGRHSRKSRKYLRKAKKYLRKGRGRKGRKYLRKARKYLYKGRHGGKGGKYLRKAKKYLRKGRGRKGRKYLRKARKYLYKGRHGGKGGKYLRKAKKYLRKGRGRKGRKYLRKARKYLNKGRHGGKGGKYLRKAKKYLRKGRGRKGRKYLRKARKYLYKGRHGGKGGKYLRKAKKYLRKGRGRKGRKYLRKARKYLRKGRGGRYFRGGRGRYHGKGGRYLQYYRKCGGFKLVGRKFNFNGIRYRLKIARPLFYRKWVKCYRSCKKVGLCFRRFYKSHYFIKYRGRGGKGRRGYKGRVHGRGRRGRGGRGRYFSLYRKCRGFKLKHKQFYYGGIGYRLKISKRKFYRSWVQCYKRYGGVKVCFRRFYKKHLFVKCGVKGWKYNKINYRTYLNKYHGFKLRHHHRRFIFKGKAYRLRCGHRKFYSAWGRCYQATGSVSICFGRLFRQRLFSIYKGHLRKQIYTANKHVRRIKGLANRHTNKISAISRKHIRNINSEANRHVKNIGYEAEKHINKFKALIDDHVNDLYKSKKQQLSALEGQHKRHLREKERSHRQHVARVKAEHRRHEYVIDKANDQARDIAEDISNGDYDDEYDDFDGRVITYNDYFKRYHGFKLTGRVFRYGKKAYRLTCKRNRFYRVWSRCYRRDGRVGLCFRRLYKQHLFKIYNDVISYNDYLNTYHGFLLKGSIFNFKNKAYKLTCKRNRFFRAWGLCYQKNGKVGLCFNNLFKRHLFKVFDDGPVTYDVYFNKYHGFPLNGKIFEYQNKVYKLSCQRQKFYNAWTRCYRKRRNVAICFQRLLQRHLFVFDNEFFDDDDAPVDDVNVVEPYLNKHIVKTQIVAHNHVKRINDVANKHVNNIAGVAKEHQYNINKQANSHVSRIGNEADKHINRFKQLVHKHVDRLNQKKKEHLRDVENQHKRHVREKEYQFKRHINTAKVVNKQHEDFLEEANAEAYSYIDYLNKFHGFKIVNGRFTWHNRGYKLLCNKNRFFNEWSNCYQDLHSRESCVNRLLGMKLFSLLPSVVSNDYEVEEEFPTTSSSSATASASSSAAIEAAGSSNDDQDSTSTAQDDTQEQGNSDSDKEQGSSSSNQEQSSSKVENAYDDAPDKEEAVEYEK